MSFGAKEWEFRARFWIIFGIFWLGFLLYSFDHVNACQAVSLWLYRHDAADVARIGRLIRVLFGVATALVVLAALVRTWAGAYLHSSIIHDAALHGEQLVADGPYRHLRNPLYLGNMLLAIGIGALASRVGFVVIVGGMFVIVYRLILREEDTLLASQGESYQRYYHAVPRLWPSIASRVPASGTKPNWADGFSGEFMMWAAAAAMVAFTLTERIQYFWIAFGTGLAIYFLQAYLRARAKKASA